MPPLLLHAPCAVGDVLDRLTILSIKTARLPTAAARSNALREFDLLCAAWRDAGLGRWSDDADAAALVEVNTALWEIEDDLRAYEAVGEFGAAFVAAARRVYALNDRRAALKRAVNERRGSALVEEKHHPAYPGAPS